MDTCFVSPVFVPAGSASTSSKASICSKKPAVQSRVQIGASASEFAGARRSTFVAGVEISAGKSASFAAPSTFEVQCAIPLLDYKPTTTNTRVATISQDLLQETPAKYTKDFRPSAQDIEDLIWASYRQIYGEHQILAFTRQAALESQIRQGEITTKEFIKGLVTSEFFLRSNFETVSNYRFVKLVLERVLGRKPYNQEETIAWSIVIAKKGVAGFVEAVQSTPEYNSVFGDYGVPYQRIRVLPVRLAGEVPFNIQTPRYDSYYRLKYSGLPEPSKVYDRKTFLKGYDATYATPVTQKNHADFEIVSKKFGPVPVAKIGVTNAGYSLPLLDYTPSSKNWRVKSIGVGLTEEKAKAFTTSDYPSPVIYNEIIYAAYRQIFGEHQILSSSRQKTLESAFRNGDINVRGFISGLAKSPAFLEANFETNSNYRFVQLIVQRLLGRDTYNEAEKIAWSIVIANEGVSGFIDAVVDSEEYSANFGDYVVPYQRARILPNRAAGETPHRLQTPRYTDYYRDVLGFPKFNRVGDIKKASPPKFPPKNGEPAQWLDSVRKLSVAQLPPPPLVYADPNYLTKVPRR